MDTLLVQDPRTRVTSHVAKEHVIVHGASRVSEYVETSSSYSVTNANWSIQPPSTKTIVDRRLQLKCYVRVTPLGGGAFQFGTNDALRAFPLASAMENLNVNINGNSLSDSIGARISAMMTLNNKPQDRTDLWSMSPAMPDSYQNLSDWTLYGSGKNPLADYGENPAEDPRGGFPRVATDGQPGSFDFELSEPLFLDPLIAGPKGDDEGFTNINNLDIKITWVSDLGKMFTHSSAGDPLLTGVQVEFYRAPELLLRYFTPKQNQPLPALQVLPYTSYTDVSNSIFTLGARGTASSTRTVRTSSVKLNQIPRRVMIFARRSKGTTDFSTADSFANISRISFLWNNETNLMSSADERQLWGVSVRNGSNLSWQQWNEYRGSVFVGEFGIDIGLLQGLSPGIMGQFTLSAEVDLVNKNTDAVEYDLYMTVQLEGSVQISENAMAVSLGNLTVQAVEEAVQGPEVLYSHAQDATGGSFFSSMKHFFNKLSRGVQSAAGVASKLAPAISVLNPEIGALVGTGARVAGEVAGIGRRATGGRFAGGGLSGGGMSGGGFSGGAYGDRDSGMLGRRYRDKYLLR